MLGRRGTRPAGAWTPARAAGVPVLVLSGVLLLAGCPEPSPGPPRPGVLILTIDRFANLADPEVELPDLDALRAEGVVFEDAIAASPDLRANCAAILTGQHPGSTGCHTLFQPVPPESWTVAERCYEQDVWTGAVVAVAPMANALGLEQGFEQFDGTLYDGPDQVLPVAERWLAERGASDGGFLIWLHLGGEVLGPVDRAVGSLRAALEEHDLAGRTTIVLAGTRGILATDEVAMAVPLVVHHPDIRSGRRTERVSLLDIAPTVLELLVGHPGDGHDATSLVGPLLGLPADGHAIGYELDEGARRFGEVDGWRMERAGTDAEPGALTCLEGSVDPEPSEATTNALRSAVGLEPLPPAAGDEGVDGSDG